MSTCHTKPTNSRAMIQAVGQDLVRKRGKQNYYAVSDIRESVLANGYPIDVSCWALAVFSSPPEFMSHHEAMGETCDYFAMRAEILPDLASNWSFSWPDLDLSWLEWPDIEWQELISFECLNPFNWIDGL